MGQAAKPIVSVIAVVASIYAGPQIGAAIMESMGTTAAAAGVSESIVGAAAIKGTSDAVNAAIDGKNINGILEAGAKGIVTGGAGQAAAEYAVNQFGAPVQYGTDVGSDQSKMLAAQEASGLKGEPYMPTPTKSALASGASSATKAALSGQDPLTAGVKGAVTGFGSEYVAGLAGQPGSAAYDIAKFGAGQTLSSALGGKGTTFTPTDTTGGTSVTTTGAGQSPGSSALAQALRTDLGAPIFGGDKDKEGRKSGWNVESLRYMGDVGEA